MKPTIAAAAFCCIIAFASCTQAPVEYVHRVDTLITRDTVYLEHPIDTNAFRLRGRLYGWAVLHDYLQTTPDHSGISVRFDNTGYEALTDSSGKWMVDSLPTGTYNITFSKEGFTSSHLYGVQFVGGGDAYTTWTPPYLARIPTMTVTGLRLKDWATPNYYLDGGLSSAAPGVSVVIYVGRDWDVSSDPSTYVASYSITTDPATGQFVPNSHIRTDGFKQDELMYVAAYPVYNVGTYSYPEYVGKGAHAIGPRSGVIRILVQ